MKESKNIHKKSRWQEKISLPGRKSDDCR